MEVSDIQTSSRYEALKKVGMTVHDADSKIEIIEEWMKRNDFPEQLSRNVIEMFLIRNKFKVEIIKKKIEMYYEIRHQIPEFFKGKHPQKNKMKQIMKVVYYVFSPKLTPEFYTVNFFKLIDENPKSLIANDFCGLVVNIAELKLIQNVYSLGDIYVCDLKGCSISHIFYFGIGTVRKLTKVTQEVFPMSIKAIHFVNCPGFMKTLLSILKAVMNPKVFSRIVIHDKPEDVANFVSKDILPKEFGGENGSLNEMNDFLTRQFAKFHSRFDELKNINDIMTKERETTKGESGRKSI